MAKFAELTGYVSCIFHTLNAWCVQQTPPTSLDMYHKLPGTLALLTLGAHPQRELQYLVCVCVCVCVCVSVTQHLTFYMFIHATNDTNLLGGG